MKNQSKQRALIEMQGYVGVPDADVNDIFIWSRFAPAVCLAWVIGALATQSAEAFFGLTAVAVAGATLPRHPFDFLYNAVVRRWTGSIALPAHGAPRRFACALAAVLLMSTGVAITLHMHLVTWTLGVLMIVMPSVVVTTGFCVPSFTYRKLQRLVAAPVGAGFKSAP
jgi:hypothetical protein